MDNILNSKLKTKYDTYDEEIPVYRGLIHGLTWPIFLFWGYPIISLNYLVSFLYHRVPIDEETTKFWDHIFVALRILSFPEAVPSKFWNRYKLLTIPIAYYLLFHRVKKRYNFQDIEYYFTIQKLMIFFSLVVAFSTKNKKIAIAGLMYLLPGLIFFFKRGNLQWHGKWWCSHDDFHLILFFLDVYMCLYYKPERFLLQR